MVKTIMSSITMAMVAADDVTSLLQMFAGLRQSQGQRILAAVAEEGNDTICVQAVAGDVAPVTGSFTARMSQQAVVVAAGSVAGEAGSFCVAKQDVLLIQRTFGLNTARDFEAALSLKSSKATTTTTTTTMDWATFDFEGDLTKEVKVYPQTCASLVQTLEASVSDKAQPCPKNLAPVCSNGVTYGNECEAAGAGAQNPTKGECKTSSQRRVCECQAFLKSTVDTPDFLVAWEAKATAQVLLQRNFDAALASKSTANKATTTTTTKKEYDRAPTADSEAMAKVCTVASAMSWAQAAKELNNPAYADLYKSFGITGGWQHCDKSWVVHGACAAFVPAIVTPTVAATTVAATTVAATTVAETTVAATTVAATTVAATTVAATTVAATTVAATTVPVA